jgi:hypothetical protein
MTDTNKIAELFNQMADLEASISKLQKEHGAVILAIKDAAGDATFTYEGQLFQVRVRNGSPYMVPLKRAPGEWLAEARAKKAAKADAAVEANVISEVTGESTAPAASELPQVKVVGSDIVIE